MIEEGKVIEPLMYLYKDEVRDLGKELNIPNNLLERHPFPGPGLAIRCLCTKEIEPLENKNSIEKKLLDLLGEEYKFKVLNIKSVGVQGDSRTYKHPVVLYGKRFTAIKNIQEIASLLVNKIKEINRVLYLVSDEKQFQTHILDNQYVSERRIEKLRKSDNYIYNLMKEFGIYNKIWQFPVIQLPVGEKESLVLRPVTSLEAMTASVFMLNDEFINNITSKMQNKYTNVFYDITHKPPGTIEWE